MSVQSIDSNPSASGTLPSQPWMTAAATRAVIEACLDVAAMVQIQEDVIAGRRPPEY